MCAATGHGKTTVLIGLAKKAVKQGYRVLYIGTEQVVEMLAGTFGPINIDFVLKSEGVSLADCIGEDQYDIILYDYLGAESGANRSAQEWQIFRDQADYLSNFAIEHNACVLTAAQADISITDKKLTIGEIPNSGKYVSFAKHIIDKVSAAAYIIKKDEATYMVMIKARYKPMQTTPKVVFIDYVNKEVL